MLCVADPKEGEQYIRAGSGRAAWKLVEKSASSQEDSTPSPLAIESEGVSNDEQEQGGREGSIQEGKAEAIVEEEKGEREGEELTEGDKGKEGEELKERDEELEGSQGAEGVTSEGKAREEDQEGTEEEQEVATSQEDGNEDVAEQNAPPTAPDSVMDADGRDRGTVESNSEGDAISPQAEDGNAATSPSHDQSHDESSEPQDNISQTHNKEASLDTKSNDDALDEGKQNSTGVGSDSGAVQVETASDQEKVVGDDLEKPTNE